MGDSSTRESAAATAFPAEVVRAYRRGERVGSVLRVAPPRAWILLVCVAVIVILSLVTASVAQVEVTSRGQGILRASTGSHGVTLEVEGSVAEIRVVAGDYVERGQELLRLHSTQLQARLVATHARAEHARERLEHLRGPMAQIHQQRLDALDRRASALRQGARLQRRSVGRAKQRKDSQSRLDARGYGTQDDTLAVDDALDLARRELTTVDDALARIDLERAQLQHAREVELARWQGEAGLARGDTAALTVLLEGTRVTAPASGYLDSLTVRTGAVVAAGQTVARIVPREPLRDVTVLLPERDAAFVEVGAIARLEAHQYPRGEFGTVDARVMRVSDDLVTHAAAREAFGETVPFEGPHYRVDLRLQPAPGQRGLAKRLRVGTLVEAVFIVRRRRAIELVFDPIKRWMD